MSDIPLSKRRLRVVVTIDTKVTGFELLAPGGVSGENPRVGRCDFLLNPTEPVDADFWIVFANARPSDGMRCAAENTLFIAAEPEEKKVYPKRFYAQFHRIIDTHRRSGHPRLTLHAPCLSWQYGYNQSLAKFETGYGELIGMRPQETVRNKVSVVCSDAAFTPGQRDRLLFLARLKERLGENLAHFGRGFEPIDDKRDAIQGYRFHLAMENCRAPHYWTEKILDSYLGWAFPLYIGCPNLDEYFPGGSFLRLDIKSPDVAADQILAMLAKPRDEAETAAVAKGRELVLNKHNPWIMWAKWAEEFHDHLAKSADLVIRSHKAYRPFPRGHMYRLKIALNQRLGSRARNGFSAKIPSIFPAIRNPSHPSNE